MKTVPAAIAGPPAEGEYRRSIERLSPAVALRLPLLLAFALLGFGFVPFIRQNQNLLWSFWAAVGVLLVWRTALVASARGSRRTFALDIVLRRPHYLQACVQGSLLAYWGWYWPPVYEYAPLIGAQLLFAYAVDMLLSWTRRDRYMLGFGPFPIVFSITFFLWFRHDWFYLQFVLVAFAMFAKDMIRWTRDGRSTHIFNPSSFPLSVFAIVLIATGTTGLTWGVEIAIAIDSPKQIYLVVFAAGLIGQFFFGVTTMTMTAITTTLAGSLVYYAMTGTYFFFDADIPIAVFLGMHLLFTDPATAPKTELGRMMFGFLYGISVLVLYALLKATGTPTFYDKLLFVPVLNLAVQWIDRFARVPQVRWIDPARLAPGLTGRRRNLAYMALWATIVISLSAAGHIGDRHPGQLLPFWQNACALDLRYGCTNLATMEDRYCRDGSAWACNELGILASTGKFRSQIPAAAAFSRACALGMSEGCQNAERIRSQSPPASLTHADPSLADYTIVLRRDKGQQLLDVSSRALLSRACDQGWDTGCEALRKVQASR